MMLSGITPWLRDEHVETLCRHKPPGGLLFGRGDTNVVRQRCATIASDIKKNSSRLNELTFESCAVVGSGAGLARSGLGPFIDSHTAVFRINLAPTKRWERDVGTRTDLRVLTHYPCACTTARSTSRPWRHAPCLLPRRQLWCSQHQQTCHLGNSPLLRG